MGIWVVSTFLAIMNNAHMNSHAFVWIYVFISVGCIPKNRIVGLYGDSIINLLKNCLPKWLYYCIFPLAIIVLISLYLPPHLLYVLSLYPS